MCIMSTVMSFTVLERNCNSESKPDPFLGVSQSPFLQANGGTRLRRLRGIFFHRPDPNVTGRCIWSWAGPRPRQNWGSLGRQWRLGTISFQNRTNLVCGPFGTSGCAYGGIMLFFNKNGRTPWGGASPSAVSISTWGCKQNQPTEELMLIKWSKDQPTQACRGR